ncbi:hypothetical protein ABIE52_006749 [Rhodococcus sp. OAS809]
MWPKSPLVTFVKHTTLPLDALFLTDYLATVECRYVGIVSRRGVDREKQSSLQAVHSLGPVAGHINRSIRKFGDEVSDGAFLDKQGSASVLESEPERRTDLLRECRNAPLFPASRVSHQLPIEGLARHF